ncbi:hypothetical protein CEP88_13100 [Roseobacter denitrificans]|nr:hypothetical protein CEP88_13100 [Roseobacter denitrificans]
MCRVCRWVQRLRKRSIINQTAGTAPAKNLDAAQDADHLRAFIADDLNATAHIKRNPTRQEDRPIDWLLYRERYLIECFFNRLKRFRRIALRCERTVSSFKAFVDLACAMAWIG